MSIASAHLLGFLNPTKMEQSVLWPVYQAASGEGVYLQNCDDHLNITGFTSLFINTDELIRADEPIRREVGQKGLLSVLLKPGSLFVGEPREFIAARESLVNALPRYSALAEELHYLQARDETDSPDGLPVSSQGVVPRDELKRMIVGVIQTTLGERGAREEFVSGDLSRRLKVRSEAVALRMPVPDYLKADPNTLNNCENTVSAYCRNWGLSSFVILPDLSDDLQAVCSRANLVRRLGDLRRHRHRHTTKGALMLSAAMEFAFVSTDNLVKNITPDIGQERVIAHARRQKHRFPSHRRAVDAGLHLFLSEWHKVLNDPEQSSMSQFSPLSQTAVRFDCLRTLGDTARSWEQMTAAEERLQLDAAEQVRRIFANA